MFTEGFPKELNQDVQLVNDMISLESYCKTGLAVSSHKLTYQILNGETICFPYRIYLKDCIKNPDDVFTKTQELIYHCIFSRSCDGFVREQHIKALLGNCTTDWVLPYVIKICDEYVVEILELVHAGLIEQDLSLYKEICRLNLKQFVYGHSRMISYWDCFYRSKCYDYRSYIGKRLFEDCFGYTRSMDKLCRKLK